MERLGRGTGLFAVVVALTAGAVPAFALLLGHWNGAMSAAAVPIAVLCLVSLIVMQPLGRLLGAGEGRPRHEGRR